MQISEPDLSLKGNKYRCLASNGLGTLWSDTVELKMFEDIEPPQLITKDLDVYLLESTQTILSADELIESLSDNCFYTEITLSKEFVDCSDLGENQIEVIATDGSGNSVSKSVVVNVIDSISPVIQGNSAALEFFSANDFYILESGTGRPSLYYDNCQISSLSNNVTNSETLIGGKLPQGKTTVKWTATDISGNTSHWYSDIIIKNTNEYNIYPNPCVDYFNIEQKLTGEYNIKVLDVMGKLVVELEKISDLSYTFSTVSLEKGTYIVQIDNGLQTKVFKLLKFK